MCAQTLHKPLHLRQFCLAWIAEERERMQGAEPLAATWYPPRQKPAAVMEDTRLDEVMYDRMVQAVLRRYEEEQAREMSKLDVCTRQRCELRQALADMHMHWAALTAHQVRSRTPSGGTGDGHRADTKLCFQHRESKCFLDHQQDVLVLNCRQLCSQSWNRGTSSKA